jgi:DNA-binding CsgD family transcriptional regulator
MIFTEKQRRLIALAAEGYTDKETARIVGKAAASVRNDWVRLLDKMDCANRTEAVAAAVAYGVVTILPVDTE